MPDTRDRRPGSYPAKKARGSEIILRKCCSASVFLGALALAILIGLFLSLWNR